MEGEEGCNLAGVLTACGVLRTNGQRRAEVWILLGEDGYDLLKRVLPGSSS